MIATAESVMTAGHKSGEIIISAAPLGDADVGSLGGWKHGHQSAANADRGYSSGPACLVVCFNKHA